MFKDQYIAVVDLETTGSNYDKGDRIIQFGCALIYNGELIQTYDLTVNPLKSIPSRIEKLTGLSNRDVANQPYFSDIAPFIYNLLEDCIFVAHNVGFDWPFLQAELKENGFPPLKGPALDTVELARILLPYEDNFSLKELCDSLDIPLDQAHQAAADAEATAELFLQLMDKARSLPLVTLEKLSALMVNFKYDSKLLFDEAIAYNRENVQSLPDDYLVVEGLLLRRQSQAARSNHQAESYPEELADKETFFGGHYEMRPDQIQMMDTIKAFLEKESPDYELAFESPAGSGKTLGYLVPAYFQASAEAPIVISTYTTLLQQELIDKHLAGLNQHVAFDKDVALLKSRQSYIDVEKFHQRIHGPLEKAEALYSGKILVWLTETVTGDLSEILKDRKLHPFFDEIRVKRSAEALEASPWADYQFYLNERKRAHHASLIVTNHSYLLHDFKKDQSDFPPFQSLILDEAHHLPDMMDQMEAQALDFRKVLDALLAIHKDDEGRESKVWAQVQAQLLAADDKDGLDRLQAFDQTLSYLYFEINEYLKDFWTYAQKSYKNRRHQHFISFDFKEAPGDLRRSHGRMKEVLEGALSTFQALESILSKTMEKDFKEDLAVEGALRSLQDLIQETEEARKTFLMLKEATKKPEDFQLFFTYEEDNRQTLRFFIYSTDGARSLKESLHRVSHVVYASATLTPNGQIDNFKERIGAPALEFHQLDSSFDFANQTRVIVPAGLADVRDMTVEEYEEGVAMALFEIAAQTDERLFVLFNSKETLEKVYDLMTDMPIFQDRPLLAQGLTGTKNRMLKQFSRLPEAILLGAGSFWEGIDLPGKALRLLVVTRLPFEAPHQLMNRARHLALKDQGANPFVKDVLPRAMMRLKQGYGRLIRSKEDRGIMIVLDRRLINSSYATDFQKILPSGVRVEEIPFDEFGSTFESFFKEGEVSDED